MKIYIYSENCTLKGRVFRGDDDEADDNGDVFLWGEGTEGELIQQALDRLAVRHYHIQSSSDSFPWRCCLSVLDLLDGPKVVFATDRMGFVVDATDNDGDDA